MQSLSSSAGAAICRVIKDFFLLVYLIMFLYLALRGREIELCKSAAVISRAGV